MENINFWLESKLVDKGTRGLFEIFSIRGNVNCVRTGPENTYYDKVSEFMGGGPAVISVWGGNSYTLISMTKRELFYQVNNERFESQNIDEFMEKIYKEMRLAQKIWVYLKSM